MVDKITRRLTQSRPTMISSIGTKLDPPTAAKTGNETTHFTRSYTKRAFESEIYKSMRKIQGCDHTELHSKQQIWQTLFKNRLN